MGNCEVVKPDGGGSMCVPYVPFAAQLFSNFLLFSLQCSQLTNPLLSQLSIVRHSQSHVSPIRGIAALESLPAMSLYFSLGLDMAVLKCHIGHSLPRKSTCYRKHNDQ